MTNESRPLLTFGPAIVGERKRKKGFSNLVKPHPSRQASRIEPQFRKLVSAFEAQRAKMGVGIPGEVDPNLVIVCLTSLVASKIFVMPSTGLRASNSCLNL